MKFEYSAVDGVPYVQLEGTEGSEAVVDACLEVGALVERPGQATRYVVRFPNENIEEFTGADLRRKLLELHLQRREAKA